MSRAGVEVVCQSGLDPDIVDVYFRVSTPSATRTEVVQALQLVATAVGDAAYEQLYTAADVAAIVQAVKDNL